VLGWQMLDYNVPGGKLNRGMAVADILKVFKKGEVRPWDARLASSGSLLSALECAAKPA
jgi:ATP-dependent protease ClpP protease subunit